MVLTMFVPNRTQLAIMQLLHGYFYKTNKTWAIIDQAWMLEKLKLWHGIEVTRDCLSKNLKKLRDEGLVKSQRRHWFRPKRGKGSPTQGNGCFEPRPSLHYLTSKLKQFFHKAANYFKKCNWEPEIPGMPVKVGRSAAKYHEEVRAVRVDKINEEVERQKEVLRMEAMDPDEARKRLFDLRNRL